jgi:hypothetical protein
LPRRVLGAGRRRRSSGGPTDRLGARGGRGRLRRQDPAIRQAHDQAVVRQALLHAGHLPREVLHGLQHGLHHGLIGHGRLWKGHQGAPGCIVEREVIATRE